MNLFNRQPKAHVGRSIRVRLRLTVNRKASSSAPFKVYQTTRPPNSIQLRYHERTEFCRHVSPQYQQTIEAILELVSRSKVEPYLPVTENDSGRLRSPLKNCGQRVWEVTSQNTLE